MQGFLVALSDPLRLHAMPILWDGGEHCVCELMAPAIYLAAMPADQELEYWCRVPDRKPQGEGDSRQTATR